MSSLGSIVHDYLAKGALEKGWGGPICRQAVDMQTHLVESVCWMIFAVLSYRYFQFEKKIATLLSEIRTELAKTSMSKLQRTMELALSALHFGMFAQLIYYKLTIKSLANLIQPCHVLLLSQGIALYSRGPTGVVISIVILPILIGTLLAIFFPDTGGLDQLLEMESYWLQHYLIQLMPIYLLCRRQYLALKFAGAQSAFFGLWITLIMHFFVYEILDLSLNVNVEFMLCPTEGMKNIFSALPENISFILWPSYRSTMTILVVILGMLLTHLYIGVSNIVKMALPPVGNIETDTDSSSMGRRKKE